MTELLIMVGIGGLVLWGWHVYHSKTNQPVPNYYWGAPAWPAMTPQIVPDIGLPPGLEQGATYYGVSSQLLEQYTA